MILGIGFLLVSTIAVALVMHSANKDLAAVQERVQAYLQPRTTRFKSLESTQSLEEIQR